MNTESLTTGYGEYPTTSSSKLADASNSFPMETLPAQTEDFSQFQTTTNQIDIDAQIPDIHTNFGTNDFTSVNLFQSDLTSSEAQMGQFTALNTENVDLKSINEVTTFDSNTQMDFGATNTFTDNTTTNVEGMDLGTNVETQYGEYQASSPIIDTVESAQITGNFVDLGAMTTSTPTFEANNFDSTSPDSIVGATSALNNIESTNYTTSEPIVDTTTTNFEMNNIDFTASTPTMDSTPAFDINAFTTPGQEFTATTTHSDLTHELVEPNPITVSKNFADEQVLYRASVPAKLDINAIAKANSTQPVVESTPSFDILAFTATNTEPVVESTPTFDYTAFTQSEPIVDTTTPTVENEEFITTTSEAVVDTTPAFDTSAFTQPIAETTQAFDTTAFTTNVPEPVVDITPVQATTPAVDIGFDLSSLQKYETTPAIDTTPITDTEFSITNLPPVESNQTVDTTQFSFENYQTIPTVNITPIETTQAADIGFDFSNLQATPVTTEQTYNEYQTSSIPEIKTTSIPTYDIPEYSAPVTIPEPTPVEEKYNIPELYTSLEPQPTTQEQVDISSLTPPLDLPTYTPTVPITTPEPYIPPVETTPIEVTIPKPVPVTIPKPAPVTIPTQTPVPQRQKVIVKVPKIKKVIVPKIKKVYVPSKKKILVKRPPVTSTIPVAKVPYATGSYAMPQVQPVQVPLLAPKPTMVTIPQRRIIQRPVAIPVQVPTQVRPMQVQTIPYSNRIINASTYRPSMQLQASTPTVLPYKQAVYRPNIKTKMVRKPAQMIKPPVPVRPVAPVSIIPTQIPSVQSYRPVQQVTLPKPAPINVIPTVRQVPAIPVQTAVVSQIAPRPIVQQVPVQKVPVQTFRPVQQVPIQSYRPLQQVPVQILRPVQQVPVSPPIATVTPINVSPIVMAAPMVPIQSMVQPMTQSVKPITYNASTYRPTMKRNYGGLPGYRPVVPVANNNVATPDGYTTRTYRPRKL